MPTPLTPTPAAEAPAKPVPPIVSIVGKKNSGKTTLLVAVAAELKRRGYRLASLKHGHHDMEIDQEGRDSWRHVHEGGAEAVILVAGTRVALVQQRGEEPDPQELIERFYAGRGYDLVLVEGYKRGPFQKVEIFRRGVHQTPIHDLADAEECRALLALVSDEPALPAPCPLIPLGGAGPQASHVLRVADLLEQVILRARGVSVMRREMHADWLAAAEARDAILADLSPLAAEHRALLEAHGRVLAEGVASPIELPPWDNSAMDGFAVRAADVAAASNAAPVELPVVDDVPAGGFPRRALRPGEAVRVMTGAPVPEGADSVVRVEHTDGGSGIGAAGARVRIRSAEDAGRNVRRRGEDLRTGQVLLRPGEVLGAAEIGVAASVGRAQLAVVRRPVVAVLASGDELVDVDGFAEVLAGRRIVSSNSYALAAQLREIGCEPRLLGIARDTPESLREHLEAARGCDALVTSAGVAVGEHDYVHQVLAGLGAEVRFWRVRMRPGSPFAYGRVAGLGAVPWFGLPGNPVSSMVTFELFVRPALLRLAGHAAVFHPTLRVRLQKPPRIGGDRTNFLRARLAPGDDGVPTATLTGAQGSHVLTSMLGADALVVVPPGDPPADGLYTALLRHGAPLRAAAGW